MSSATPEERGDTVGAAVRWPLRLIVIGLALSATIGISVLRHRETSSEEPGSSGTTSQSEVVDVEVDPEDATRQSMLVFLEDARLRSATTGPGAGISRRDGSVLLGARTKPYTLADLLRAKAAVRRSPTVVEITKPIVVRRGAELVLKAPGQTLRLRSGPDGFASIVAWGGGLQVEGAVGRPIQVVAWDDRADAVDGDVTDGRAYLRVKDGALLVKDARLQHLGFWSGRTGGLALNGGDTTLAIGSVSDSTMFDLHAGLFAEKVDLLAVDRTTIDRAEWAGIYLSLSHGIALTDVTVTSAGGNGIDLRDGTNDASLENVSVSGSVGYGIRVDGSPLASGPNAAGYPPDNYEGLTLSRTRVSDNRAGGLLVRGMDKVTLRELTAIEDRVAVQVSGSTGLVLDSSSITSTTRTAVVVDGHAQRVQLNRTKVDAPEAGVSSTDSKLSIDGGTISVEKGHGVVFEGGSGKVDGTEINGRGSAAVAHHDAEVRVSDLGGSWHYRPDAVLWLERHSALLPFLPLVPVLILGTLLVWRRHRDQIRLRAMLAESMTARGRSLLDAYQAPVRIARVPDPADTEASSAAFAVTAVLDFGHPAGRVARVLGVPTSRVRTWVEEAQSPERGMSESVGDPA